MQMRPLLNHLLCAKHRPHLRPEYCGHVRSGSIDAPQMLRLPDACTSALYVQQR